jgi:hypothetical protein
MSEISHRTWTYDRIIDPIAYNLPLVCATSDMGNQIKPSDSIDAKHHRAWDPSRICRGYTVFRFRCNGFKDPAVYHREPLSFLSEHFLVALGSTQSTDLVRVYAHLRSLSSTLVHRNRCHCRRPTICSFFRRRVHETATFEESSRKEPGET